MKLRYFAAKACTRILNVRSIILLFSLLQLTSLVSVQQNTGVDDTAIKDFNLRGAGAKCDAHRVDSVWVGTDDTRAINAILKKNVGAIRVPGTCLLSGPLVWTGPGELWALPGSGAGFVTTSPIADILEIQGADVNIQGLFFEANVPRSAGAYIKISNAARVTLEELLLDDPFVGIELSNVTTVRIRKTEVFWYGPVLAGAASSNSYAIHVHNILDAVFDDIDINAGGYDRDNEGNYRKAPDACIYIDSAGDLKIVDSNIEGCQRDLFADVGAASSLTSLRVTNTFFDTSQQAPVELYAHNGGVIARSDFVQSWTSSSIFADGFWAHTDAMTNKDRPGVIDGIDLVQHHAFLNKANGTNFSDLGIKNVSLLGGERAQNGACGDNFGLLSGFSIVGVHSGSVGGLLGNGRAGECIAPGASIFHIIANDLRGNLEGGISAGSPQSGSENYADNIGAPDTCVPYRVTMGATNGLITKSGSLLGCYRVSGARVFLNIQASIEVNGSASGALTISLPILPALTQVVGGREAAKTGFGLVGQIVAGEPVMLVTVSNNNTYPGQDNAMIVMTGEYEIR